MRQAPRAVLVTGASSGIGRELALASAGPGVTLFLLGRDTGRLEAAADSCRLRGARAFGIRVDVRDGPGMASAVADCWSEAPLDLVVANAGICRTGADFDDCEAARAVFDVNVGGTINTVLPAILPMRARGSGQIALLSSLAGLRRVGSMPAYSASKAAVRVWGQSLRIALAPAGIRVSVVCPGYVATPMIAEGSLPERAMPAPEAARRILEGLARNEPLIAFPRFDYHLIQARSLIPERLLEAVRRWR